MGVIVVDDEKAVVIKLSQTIQEIANNTIKNNGVFHIGLSGGSLVKYLCTGLPNIDTDWSKWILLFCDERLVPEDSEDSTFGAYKKDFLPKVPLKENQFIRIKQGVTAQEAANDYAQQLSSIFRVKDPLQVKCDLLLLGMGPDGHTCSLFPGHKLLDCTDVAVAAITDSPKPPPARVTLTYPIINNAYNCIFAACGAGKKDMITRILKNKEDLPAGRVNPTNGALYWILDRAAGAE